MVYVTVEIWKQKLEMNLPDKVNPEELREREAGCEGKRGLNMEGIVFLGGSGLQSLVKLKGQVN